MFIVSFLLLSLFFFFPSSAFAQCPVCIITVGGGMLLADRLGVDDLLVSIWISGLNTVLAYWLAPKIKIKPLNRRTVLSFLFYLLTLSYFYLTKELGVPQNTLLGIDKIFLGQTAGLFAVIAGNILYADTKRRRHHRSLFPYAKVVFPVGLLLVLTLFFKIAFSL